MAIPRTDIPRDSRSPGAEHPTATEVRCGSCEHDACFTARPPLLAVLSQPDNSTVLLLLQTRHYRGRTVRGDDPGGLQLIPIPTKAGVWAVRCRRCGAESRFGKRAARRALVSAASNHWTFVLAHRSGALTGPNHQPTSTRSNP